MQTEEIKKSLNGGNHKDSTDNAITSVISQQDNYSRGYSVYQPFLCKRQVLFHIFWQLIFHKKRQLIFHTYLVFDTHGVIRGLFVN